MARISGLFRVGKAEQIRANEVGGKTVLNFSVAADNNRFKDGDARKGQHPKANFFEVSLWGPLAEMYKPDGRFPLKQGENLFISGEFGVEVMLDKDGNALMTTDANGKQIPRTKYVIAQVDEIKKAGSLNSASDGGESSATVPQATREPATAGASKPRAATLDNSDIPF